MSRTLPRPLARLAPRAFLLAALVLARPAGAQQQETRLLRFPHVSRDNVVFTYAGDLYTVPLAGGVATRLTSHAGLELFGRFSPDGRQIAFSGEYAGTRQVYLVPATGGEPRQLTFYPDVGPLPPRGGYDHLVLDWTPRGDRILMRAYRTPYADRIGKYFLVDPKGGLETPLEIPEGASGATFDASGTKLAFNIVSREWRTWKRYEGGRQQDVWIYDLAAHTSQKLTDTDRATDNFPMYVGDRIYFTSDRGPRRKLNIWMHDLRTGQQTQVTRHEEFDVLWPSRGAAGIVYENGGWIWFLDPATNETRRLSISVPGDRPNAMPRWLNAQDRIESASISPSAKRVLFGARGELFTVPAEHGNIVNLSRTAAARERGAAWSPDGAWIAYLSDASGDYELYVRAADGSGEPRRLARYDGAWIGRLAWSPDSRSIAFADNANRLFVVGASGGEPRQLDRSVRGDLSDFSWSGDSRWLAYTRPDSNTMRVVWVAPAAGGQPSPVTETASDAFSPTFDPGGKYLYFVSARDYNQQNYGFESRIYAVTLRRDLPHPFPPRSDEEPGAKRGAGESADSASPEATRASRAAAGAVASGSQRGGPSPVRIDLEGITERVVALPGLRPGAYASLTATPEGVLYMAQGGLKLYRLAERDEKAVLDGISAYQPTPDFKKLLYRQGQNWGIVALAPGQKNDAGRLSFAGMELRVDPRQEWAQVFHDGWLIFRDFFYDPGMHGVDWREVYRRYQPLLEHVAHRADLDFLLSEMAGELNVGHAYVNASPESSGPVRVGVGLLGAELAADGERYRFARIFGGENWQEEFRAPLTEPGVDVHEGDYLIAIDGEDVRTSENPYRFLVNKVNRNVRLTVSDRPNGARRTYDVQPVASEQGLRYQAWVRRNAALVDSLSGGRIGYIHLPNTGLQGHRELWEGFRPLHTKEALILDDRYNGGGNIPERMAMLVGAPLLNFWARRNLDLYSQPAVFHSGPKATLINGQSSSGGDAFPYYFRELGLGPLIGERTWGGLVGISTNPSFVDGGSISAPSFAFVDSAGAWAVEGEGVHPDIEVVDRPEEIAAGREPMIERAVQYLLGELAKPQYRRPDRPAAPIRRPPDR